MTKRRTHIHQETKEMRISLQLGNDGSGEARLETSIPFFDHMLEFFSKHAVVDLLITN